MTRRRWYNIKFDAWYVIHAASQLSFFTYVICPLRWRILQDIYSSYQEAPSGWSSRLNMIFSRLGLGLATDHCNPLMFGGTSWMACQHKRVLDPCSNNWFENSCNNIIFHKLHNDNMQRKHPKKNLQLDFLKPPIPWTIFFCPFNFSHAVSTEWLGCGWQGCIAPGAISHSGRTLIKILKGLGDSTTSKPVTYSMLYVIFYIAGCLVGNNHHIFFTI